MGFLSRIFPNTSDEPDIAATASNADSVTAPAHVPAQPDNDYVQMPEELRAFIKETRGFDPMPEPVHVSKMLTPEQYAQHMEKRRAADEARHKLEPGQIMPDGTIYLGRYSPVDRDGVSLAKTFNVFAAPEDLPETMTYVDTVKHIAGLKEWHGHDGANFANDAEIYAALKDGSYNGGWIIPTCDILYGKNNNDNETTPDNIFAHKDKGSFKGTFKTATNNDPYANSWYWSSTDRYKQSQYVRNLDLSDGDGGWDRKDGNRLSCRPVRLVEVKMGG